MRGMHKAEATMLWRGIDKCSYSYSSETPYDAGA